MNASLPRRRLRAAIARTTNDSNPNDSSVCERVFVRFRLAVGSFRGAPLVEGGDRRRPSRRPFYARGVDVVVSLYGAGVLSLSPARRCTTPPPPTPLHRRPHPLSSVVVFFVHYRTIVYPFFFFFTRFFAPNVRRCVRTEIASARRSPFFFLTSYEPWRMAKFTFCY